MAFSPTADGAGKDGFPLLQPDEEGKVLRSLSGEDEVFLAPPEPWWRSRFLTITVLVVVFIANQACRALPFYLVDFSETADAEGAMNVAVGFQSGKYGFLATLGFTIPFTLGSLVAGVIADQTDRMRISALAGILWSASTFFMAGAGSYEALLGLRMLLGLSQSITMPASVSLISDLFTEARATMSSVLGLGIYLGGGLASLGAALDERFGWRHACTVFGVGSMAVSLLALVHDDPRRHARASDSGRRGAVEGGDNGAAEGHGLSRIAAALQKMVVGLPAAVGAVCTRTGEVLSSQAARWLLLAAALRFCAGFGILVWLPSAVRARFPDRAADFAEFNAMTKALAGGLSSLAGGFTSDMLRKNGFGESAGAKFCVVSSLASAPLWFMVLSPSVPFEASMGFLLAEYLTAESWLGPAVATLQGSVPADHRGAAQGVFSSLTALGNVLPVCLGLLATDDLPRGLQVSVTICYLLSAVCFGVVAVHLSRQPGPEAPCLSG